MVKPKIDEGGNLVKWISKKNRKPVLLIVILVLLIAGFLDIKYEGLFYQLLPRSVQAFLGDII